jgi:hypothetical protein
MRLTATMPENAEDSRRQGEFMEWATRRTAAGKPVSP